MQIDLGSLHGVSNNLPVLTAEGYLVGRIVSTSLTRSWLSHHRIVRRVQYVNDRLIWINIIFLFFIVLIPFSTTISGDYPNVLEAVLFFHANLFVASILLALMWWYIARHSDELNPDGEDLRLRGMERAFVMPFISVIAMGVALVNTDASFWCYALGPVIIIIIRRIPGMQ